MQSSRSRLMLVALFGVLALGAFTAAAAQAAVPAPRWSIAGTDLEEGKTHYISTKAYTPFKLTTGLIVVECKVVKLIEGALLGSKEGSAGKDNEVIEFTSCKVSGTSGGKTIAKCKVIEPIRTGPVKSELVETEKAKPEEKKGSLLTLFTPEGAEFTTIKFELEKAGEGFCPVNIKVSGSVAGRVLTDPNKGEELGELVELGQTAKEATSWLINFPATPIKEVTKINKEVRTEAAVGLLVASEPATLEGTALVLLAKKNTTTGLLETEETKWSPLP